MLYSWVDIKKCLNYLPIYSNTYFLKFFSSTTLLSLNIFENRLTQVTIVKYNTEQN